MSKSPRRTLIVIDVQNEYVTGKMRIAYPPVETSLHNIGRAMDVAKEAAIPVVVVQHDAPATSPIFAEDSDSWQLHSVVATRACDHTIGKTMASAFTGTGLKEWLDARGIDTVAVVGYMTHNCDASTIFAASHLGYKVEFLSDASGSLPYENAGGKASAEEIHRVFCTVFHSNFAAVVKTDEWIAAVGEGKALERDSVYLSHQRAKS